MNINIFDAILNVDAILIFQDWQQIFCNRTVQVVLHIQYLEHFIQRFRYKKLVNFCVKDEQLAKFKQS
jgi:hypothetical protein